MATLAPPDAAPARDLACPRCGEPYARADYLALHVARHHVGPLTVEERAAFERALREEEAWLQVFRRRVKGGLAALAPLSITGAVFLLVYVSGSPVSMALLMIPPALGFAGLAYLFASQAD